MKCICTQLFLLLFLAHTHSAGQSQAVLQSALLLYPPSAVDVWNVDNSEIRANFHQNNLVIEHQLPGFNVHEGIMLSCNVVNCLEISGTSFAFQV